MASCLAYGAWALFPVCPQAVLYRPGGALRHLPVTYPTVARQKGSGVVTVVLKAPHARMLRYFAGQVRVVTRAETFTVADLRRRGLIVYDRSTAAYSLTDLGLSVAVQLGRRAKG